MIGRSMKDVDAAGNYPRPKAGGYVIRITKATNNVEKERTEFEFDIAEGQFRNYYQELYERAHFWGGAFSKSFSDKALPFYKGFTEAVVASNDNTDGLVIGNYDDIDETKFIGKLVGMVVGEKEYTGNDGKIKIKLDTYEAVFLPATDIRAGMYTVPEFKSLETTPAPTGKVVDTTNEIPEEFKASADDTPF